MWTKQPAVRIKVHRQQTVNAQTAEKHEKSTQALQYIICGAQETKEQWKWRFHKIILNYREQQKSWQQILIWILKRSDDGV
jgi:hypothetical protein